MQSENAIKFQSDRDHPTACIIKDVWPNSDATYPPDREPFYIKCQEGLDDINVADVP